MEGDGDTAAIDPFMEGGKSQKGLKKWPPFATIFHSQKGLRKG
jgi:hypothetical protein